jgi:hypothetical protein
MTNEPLWRRLYLGWLVIAGRFGHVQTQVILALFYAFLIGPIALGLAVSRRDLLHKRGLRAGETAWNDADSAAPDLERARLLS